MSADARHDVRPTERPATLRDWWQELVAQARPVWSAWQGQLGRKAATAAPETWVGVFGKHPSALDHLTDVGDGDAAPPSLGEVAGRLYFGGIRAAVAGDVWRDAEAAGTAVPFGHAFLHRPANRPRHLVVGRLWASRDGVQPKPRADFPMVAVAEVSHGGGVTVQAVLGVLRTLEAACKATASREGVVAALGEARSALATLDAEARGNSPPPAEGELAAETTGDEAVRLYPSGGDAAARLASIPPLPPGSWAFSPDGAAWVDVVGGRADLSAFACLRLRERA